MKVTRYISILSCLILLVTACNKKPKACLEIGDTLEAKRFQTITSCSEDYEFLSWEFSDGIGSLSDSVYRTFEEEKNYSVTLTAYADGAYRSDEIVQDFKTSYRYIDRFEIIGESDFGRMQAEVELQSFVQQETKGVYTVTSPLVIGVWPQNKVRIRPDRLDVKLIGYRNGNSFNIINEKVNFESVEENPVELSDSDFTLRLFWRYRD